MTNSRIPALMLCKERSKVSLSKLRGLVPDNVILKMRLTIDLLDHQVRIAENASISTRQAAAS